jgi:damage-control phosphatase, subfamily I
MQIHDHCLVCTLKTFVDRLHTQTHLSLSDKENHIRSFLLFLAEADYTQTPVELGCKMHRRIRTILDDADPYWDDKQRYNQKVMDRYPEFQSLVRHSDSPFNTALKLAILGNIIDFGANHPIQFDELIDQLDHLTYGIDHIASLKQNLSTASTVLYLGDNCGEIVLDKLFLETLLELYPDKQYVFAVRGAPIINDATRVEAEQLGIHQLVTLIDNGYDAPGTVLSKCNSEFQSWFKEADLVISKGQGNFEGLSDITKTIYFLLMVKCNIVANHLGVPKGSIVVSEGGTRRTPQEKQ